MTTTPLNSQTHIVADLSDQLVEVTRRDTTTQSQANQRTQDLLDTGTALGAAVDGLEVLIEAEAA